MPAIAPAACASLIIFLPAARIFPFGGISALAAMSCLQLSEGSLPRSPLTIRSIHAKRMHRRQLCPIAFGGVATVMSSLKITPVLGCFARRSVSELAPTRNRFDLVDYEAERMLCVAWLVVVDRTEASAAYSARCGHSFEPPPVFSPEGSVGLSWIFHAVLPCPLSPGQKQKASADNRTKRLSALAQIALAQFDV